MTHVDATATGILAGAAALAAATRSSLTVVARDPRALRLLQDEGVTTRPSVAAALDAEKTAARVD